MPARSPDLYTASQVAAFCGVDQKTIHMWCSRGEMRFFRTPGRQLRFRRADVVEFLRKYGYPVPEDLIAQSAPRVYVIDEDASWLKLAQRALARSFTVTAFDDPYDGIIAVGADVPDAVALGVKLSALDGYRCVARLHELPATRRVNVVACSVHGDAKKRSLDAGAVAFVLKPDVEGLRAALKAQLGVQTARAVN